MTKITRRTAVASLAAAPIAAACPGAGLAATHTVIIEGFKYHPAVLEVAVNDQVEFINRDRTPHTATAVTKRWDTGQLARNASAKVVISSAGDHSYYCRPHKAMKGVIWAR